MRTGRVLAGAAAALLALAVSVLAAAEPPTMSVAEAEAFVRARYYEGLPYERALDLPAAAVPALAAILEDPAEREHHANALLALGISARPGAYEALAAYAAAAPRGAVDPAVFDARSMLSVAMGHLARSDERALDWLVARLGAEASDPGWSYAAMSAAELGALLREQAATGLAVSARPEAAALLRGLSRADARALDGPVSERMSAHASRALSTLERIRSEGRSEAFGRPSAGEGR